MILFFILYVVVSFSMHYNVELNEVQGFAMDFVKPVFLAYTKYKEQNIEVKIMYKDSKRISFSICWRIVKELCYGKILSLAPMGR